MVQTGVRADWDTINKWNDKDVVRTFLRLDENMKTRGGHGGRPGDHARRRQAACGPGGPCGVLCPTRGVPESVTGRGPAWRTAALRDDG